MDYPKLRYVEAFPVEEENLTRIYIRDPLNYAKTPLLIPYPTYFILTHFDGQHSLLEIQNAFAKQFKQTLSREKLNDVIRQLDQYHYLESERFVTLRNEIHDAFYRSPVRDMAHADTCYSSRPEVFAEQMTAFFSSPQGPGLPHPQPTRAAPLRGLIAPHIDLRVGGPAYACGYKELAERCDADLFILLGTSHYGMENLFVATEKDYNTPLGPVHTDREFLRAFQSRYPEDVFADQLLHRTEHSLEFQAIFLKYVFGNTRPFTIVPLLVSSFHHMVISNTPPVEVPRVAAFLHALKATIAESQKKICFVAGVDFAHVGQKFGDEGPLTEAFLNWVQNEDLRLIEALEKVDHADFFAQIAKDNDKRRVCGFAPMYTFLHLVGASKGKLLKYDRSIDSVTQSSVSFASMAFY